MQHAVLSIIAGKGHIRISGIIRHNKNKKIGTFYWKTKIKICGARYQEFKHNWNNLAAFSVPSNGRKKKGRPAMRWLGGMVRAAGPNWAILWPEAGAEVGLTDGSLYPNQAN